MTKKAIDQRIPVLIRNGIQSKERSFFVMVGDRGRNQIPNFHFLMMSNDLKMNKNVLWAYKHKLLGFTSHKLKREKKIKKEIKRGLREANDMDPFEMFISNVPIRYVYYKETDKILGNTYGMCILQDFESITPNLLAKTIETVEGGGIVIIMLKTMQSLKQMYTMMMDVHKRYRTEAHGDVVARFNERFLLSLRRCRNCLVIDDEMNVLSASGALDVVPLPPLEKSDSEFYDAELVKLNEGLKDVLPAGQLIPLTKTFSQAQAVLTFIDIFVEKNLNNTVVLTAARGRGKSAALGIAISSAIALGYSNIYVTSPSPENLITFFQFVFKGFDALGYSEHLHYDITQSTAESLNKVIVRVDVKIEHRQTIQYISPNDSYMLSQAEILVIDEAAAIPLTLVKKLMGPYLILMSSTINGYEGTGRSLSLKLILQLRNQSLSISNNESLTNESVDKKRQFAIKSRVLKELELDEPIRYIKNDPVEKWLNELLCLDVCNMESSNSHLNGTPHPSQCELYYVNRDTLFSSHPLSEYFLRQMVSLYVSSHYKNSPNDLQLMSDAPAHHLFVLCSPTDKEDTVMPIPLCVIQILLEGQISEQTMKNSLYSGKRASGDLIPWLVSQQFQDENFASLSGARIVRIATNPDYMNMGYGSKAIELLTDYLKGNFVNLDENVDIIDYTLKRISDEELENETLHSDVNLRDVKTLPPLLLKLNEIPLYNVDYLGVSYGLTPLLYKFWSKMGFVPVYIRQTPNELTGEYTSVMLKYTKNQKNNWLMEFAKDFQSRFLRLLAFEFASFSSSHALNIFENCIMDTTFHPLTKDKLNTFLTQYDLKRLDSYSKNILDYHVILDLVPIIADMYFSKNLDLKLNLSSIQKSILLSIGFQHKKIDSISNELNIQVSQLLAILSKIIRKFSSCFTKILTDTYKKAIEDDLQVLNDDVKPISLVEEQKNLDNELNIAGTNVISELKKKQKDLIKELNLDKYAIDNDDEWKSEFKTINKAVGTHGIVSLKSKQRKKSHNETASTIYEKEMELAKKHKKNSQKKN